MVSCGYSLLSLWFSDSRCTRRNSCRNTDVRKCYGEYNYHIVKHRCFFSVSISCPDYCNAVSTYTSLAFTHLFWSFFPDIRPIKKPACKEIRCDIVQCLFGKAEFEPDNKERLYRFHHKKFHWTGLSKQATSRENHIGKPVYSPRLVNYRSGMYC